MVWCKMQMQFMFLFKVNIRNCIQHDLGLISAQFRNGFI